MNIFSEPLVNYVILFSFLIFFFQNRERIVICNLFKQNCDYQLIQNRAALVYMLFITAYNSLK